MVENQAFRLEKAAEADFPTRFGPFRIYGFIGHFGGQAEEATPSFPGASALPRFIGHSGGQVEEAVVLKMGSLDGEPPIVRIHSQCLTGDV